MYYYFVYAVDTDYIVDAVPTFYFVFDTIHDTKLRCYSSIRYWSRFGPKMYAESDDKLQKCITEVGKSKQL